MSFMDQVRDKKSMTTKLPDDIPTIKGTNNLYHKDDIIKSGYSMLGELNTFDDSSSDAPNGIHVWSNGNDRCLYLFLDKSAIDKNLINLYQFGGYAVKSKELE
jgi:hypothetical protein